MDSESLGCTVQRKQAAQSPVGQNTDYETFPALYIKVADVFDLHSL